MKELKVFGLVVDLTFTVSTVYALGYLSVFVIVIYMALHNAVFDVWATFVYRRADGSGGEHVAYDETDFPVEIVPADDVRGVFTWSVKTNGDREMSSGGSMPQKAYLVFTYVGWLYQPPDTTCVYEDDVYPCQYFQSVPGKIDRLPYRWEIWK